MKHLCLALTLLAACSTPTRNGQSVDSATFQRAEQRCRERAIARYGPPPTDELARESEQSCDPQSWLCRRASTWMMDPGNRLSTATPWERTVHRSVRRCLEEQGYSLP